MDCSFNEISLSLGDLVKIEFPTKDSTVDNDSVFGVCIAFHWQSPDEINIRESPVKTPTTRVSV